MGGRKMYCYLGKPVQQLEISRMFEKFAGELFGYWQRGATERQVSKKRRCLSVTIRLRPRRAGRGDEVIHHRGGGRLLAAHRPADE